MNNEECPREDDNIIDVSGQHRCSAVSVNIKTGGWADIRGWALFRKTTVL